MELYYKPNKRGGARIIITDDMPAEIKEAQRAIAEANGLLPVRNYSVPPSTGPFGYYVERFAPVTDENGDIVAYAHSWVFRPNRIHLSQTRILADEAVAPLLPTLVPALSGDPDLSTWWANDMTYVRGSAMAQRAMEVLGLSQVQLETVVLRCRG